MHTVETESNERSPAFRLDVPVHSLLTQPGSLIVRTDGTLAPCFPMYSATYDWGTIENHKFETKQLTEMKKSCQPHCFSTLNHILRTATTMPALSNGCSGRRSTDSREPLTSTKFKGRRKCLKLSIKKLSRRK